MPTKD